MGALTLSVIAGVQGALPPHRYSQDEVTESFFRVPGFEASEHMVRKLDASPKVLDSIGAAARLALHLPPVIQHLVAHASQIHALDRAVPRCEIVSSSPSANVIPSAPAWR
jgi:predicted naringenin-chalcone synthase